jgi:excisionase family DNA binding protein
MTVAEAAAALEIGEEYVRRLLRRGTLIGVPFGGRTGWRLPRDYVIGLQAQIAAAKEGKEAARRRLIAGPRPAGRPRKSAGKDGGRTSRGRR